MEKAQRLCGRPQSVETRPHRIPVCRGGKAGPVRLGWIHNKVGMDVGRFLEKGLLIPWQEGARWFWDTLVDADLADNTLGWQWSAGCCASSQPYFRIFNPVLQAKNHVTDGAYLRRWIPALADRAGMALYAPWTAARPPPGYPPPIVDLSASRRRALAAYAQFRRAQEEPGR